MSEPLVSVVIPVFNGLPYVREALASVVAQTYPNVEICMVDGGSSDGSREWLREVAHPWLRTAELPSGTGAAANWTYTTSLATGAYVKLLCQDDLLAPDALAWQVQELEAHPDCVAAIGTRDIISASGRLLYASRGLSRLPDGIRLGHEVLRACYLSGTNIIGEPHTVLFRTDALKAAMPWNDSRPFLLDLDTYTSVLGETGTTVRTSHRSVGSFRVSTSSWSTRLLRQQRDQMAQWQSEYERSSVVQTMDRVRARVGVNAQVAIRRAAYLWLRARRDMAI